MDVHVLVYFGYKKEYIPKNIYISTELYELFYS